MVIDSLKLILAIVRGINKKLVLLESGEVRLYEINDNFPKSGMEITEEIISESKAAYVQEDDCEGLTESDLYSPGDQ